MVDNCCSMANYDSQDIATDIYRVPCGHGRQQPLSPFFLAWIAILLHTFFRLEQTEPTDHTHQQVIRLISLAFRASSQETLRRHSSRKDSNTAIILVLSLFSNPSPAQAKPKQRAAHQPGMFWCQTPQARSVHHSDLLTTCILWHRPLTHNHLLFSSKKTKRTNCKCCASYQQFCSEKTLFKTRNINKVKFVCIKLWLKISKLTSLLFFFLVLLFICLFWRSSVSYLGLGCSYRWKTRFTFSVQPTDISTKPLRKNFKDLKRSDPLHTANLSAHKAITKSEMIGINTFIIANENQTFTRSWHGWSHFQRKNVNVK